METASTHFSAASKSKSPDGDLDRILDILRTGETFLVVSHQNPEGDAIGSTLALSFALRDLRKAVTCYNQDGVPENFKFLPGTQTILTSLPRGVRFDGICVVDCGDVDLVGPAFGRWRESSDGNSPILVIDHHKTNRGYGTWNYVDPLASSTGEVIHRVLSRIPVEITPPIASQIYTAILSDTGSFRYSNTTPETFRVAEELVRQGADPWEIAQNVYERQPLARMKLLGMVLSTLETYRNGTIASLTVLKEMYDATGGRKEDTEEFINYARAIDGVEVSLLFREIEDGRFRTSLRSRGTVDVSRLAQQFGGGGHHNAAGCTVAGTLDEVKKKVLSAAIASLDHP